MKILIASHTGVYTGGAERSLHHFVKSLNINHNVVVNIPDANDQLMNNLNNDGIQTSQIFKDNDKTSLKGFIILLLLKKTILRCFYIIKQILFMKKNKFDVIYCNTIRTISELIAGKILGIKCIMHIRGFDTNYKFRYKFLRFADKVIVLNKSSKEFLIKLDIDKNKIHIVPNGVVLSDKYNDKYDKKKYKLLYIGPYSYLKGVDIFLNICDSILKQDNFEIHHFGKTNPLDEFAKKEISKFDRILKDSNYFEHSFNPKVTDEIHKYDFFLMTSRSEGMPRTLLECMEKGVIPIVSNISALTDIIENGKNGFYFDINNHFDATSILNRVYNNKELIQKISQEARKYIHLNHDIKKVNFQIEKLIIK